MRRSLTPELMDEPGLDAAEHARALRGLARLNALARSDEILWPAVRDTALAQGGRASLLDIATGSGDVPLALARRAREEGLSLELAACDVSRVAIEQTGRRASERGVAIEVWRQDVVWGPFSRRFDIVTCSLFLHHLDRESAVMLLKNAGDATGRVLLVSDLRRTPAGLALAWAASRVVTGSRIVRVDAVKSVRAAYTAEELAGMAADAGLRGAEVRRCWPQRMLLTWRRA